MAKHLVRWHKKYGKKGLVILDINDGEIDDKADLKDHVKRGKIPYPTLHDVDGRNCETYGIRAYPASYLIGVDGKVIWEGFALPRIKKVEKTIQQELKKVKKKDLPKTKKDDQKKEKK